MVSPNENESNPYQAPATELGGLGGPAPSRISREVVKKFRDQVVALGALWIILGSLLAVVSVLGLSGSQALSADFAGNMQILLVIFAAMGLTWIELGVLSCLKKMWAIYVGLVLSYASLLGNAATLNLGSIIIVILVIVQAHRVLGWAKQLKAAGVPLTARP